MVKINPPFPKKSHFLPLSHFLSQTRNFKLHPQLLSILYTHHHLPLPKASISQNIHSSHSRFILGSKISPIFNHLNFLSLFFSSHVSTLEVFLSHSFFILGKRAIVLKLVLWVSFIGLIVL